MRLYKYEVVKMKNSTQFEWRISYLDKIIGYGTGYNTKQTAMNGIRAICKSMGGDWSFIKTKIIK